MQIETDDSWKVELFRFSAFPQVGSVFADQDSWWQSIVGIAPESITNKPKEGITQYSGQINDFSQLILSCQPDRIDWQLLPSQEQSLNPEFPTLGKFGEAIPIFANTIDSWFNLANTELQRIALGIVLVQPVKDRIEGYNKISQYLPNINLDSEGSSDFSYSINRPRTTKSTVENLIINRLSKWAVVALKMFSIPVDGKEKLNFTGKTTTLCRLELDINTAKELAILPKEKLHEIFHELVDLAQEIAVKGDIK